MGEAIWKSRFFGSAIKNRRSGFSDPVLRVHSDISVEFVCNCLPPSLITVNMHSFDLKLEFIISSKHQTDQNMSPLLRSFPSGRAATLAYWADLAALQTFLPTTVSSSRTLTTVAPARSAALADAHDGDTIQFDPPKWKKIA